jgi:branched-chain amino acid transport system substrate-binding protein
MRHLTILVATSMMLMASCATSGRTVVVVGAVYPLTGPQGPGGTQELRGVRIAAQISNARGGSGEPRIVLEPVDAPSADAAGAAVDRLARDDVNLVVGSYGSTISRPAAAAAARKRMLFWETGAVGEMLPLARGRLVFRFAPTGSLLGRSAISFIARRVVPKLKKEAASLRYAVLNVDDVYGRSVARGAADQIRRLGLRFVGRFSYPVDGADPAKVVRRLKAVNPDVLFVSAYLEDGVKLRRETIRQHLELVSSIGTSSSYCMPQFGNALGRGAVGLFASDKPDADSIDPRGLSPEAGSLLHEALSRYRARFGEEMPAPALSGFAAAWALFAKVLPQAHGSSSRAVAAAARSVTIARGALPNGSGLDFAEHAAGDQAGANLRATSVIWEWVGVDRRAVVWPPRFATHRIDLLPLVS